MGRDYEKEGGGRGPKEVPKRPKEAPKRPPGGPQEAPERPRDDVTVRAPDVHPAKREESARLKRAGACAQRRYDSKWRPAFAAKRSFLISLRFLMNSIQNSTICKGHLGIPLASRGARPEGVTCLPLRPFRSLLRGRLVPAYLFYVISALP